MRPLPDPDLSLRDASDFVFDSLLCRRALSKPSPSAIALVLRELITGIHRLTVSCHMPEFTDHGLGHLCSLIHRLSQWSVSGSGTTPRLLVEGLSEEECAVLLLATLLHDVGMLSQRPEDLPIDSPDVFKKPLRDVPTWVRKTHVQRLEGVARRLFESAKLASLLGDSVVKRSFAIAKAHSNWPWDWKFTDRDAALAALVAVADLLDEDSARCDTATLLHHRLGTAENCAHWIRHGLTVGRVTVQQGQAVVKFARPPGTDSELDRVFVALRNHYLLAHLYVDELAVVGGQFSIRFEPDGESPQELASELAGWERLPDFQTQSALVFHLLGCFMPEALLDRRRVSDSNRKHLDALGLSEVELSDFYMRRGITYPRMPIEQSFLALLGRV